MVFAIEPIALDSKWSLVIVKCWNVKYLYKRFVFVFVVNRVYNYNDVLTWIEMNLLFQKNNDAIFIDSKQEIVDR